MTDLVKTAEAAGLTPAEATKALKAAGKKKYAPPEMSRVLTMAQVGRALGISTRAAKRRMRKRGIAFQDEVGGHWEVTKSDLRRHYKKYWVEIELEAARQDR